MTTKTTRTRTRTRTIGSVSGTMCRLPFFNGLTLLVLLPLILIVLGFTESSHGFRANPNSNCNSNCNYDSNSNSNCNKPRSLALCNTFVDETGDSETQNETQNETQTKTKTQQPDVLSTTNLSVGFLGCGTIASSIARGLFKANNNNDSNNDQRISIPTMVVSERSESKSKALVEDLMSRSRKSDNDDNNDDNDNHDDDSSSTLQIFRTSHNQEIIDACQLIFLTVLPQQASNVLQTLQFDPNKHVLVSLVSTANLNDLVTDSKLPLSRVAKMICLPSIANHEGVALLCCGNDGTETASRVQESLKKIFDATGGVVCLQTEADLEACMVTTCTMGPLYGTMKNQRDWLLEKTSSLSRADATTLVIKQFAGAVGDALRNCHNQDRLEDLIDEQTPGGLNEQALRNYGTVLQGFSDLQEPVMDAILNRIRGETDGSIEAKNGAETQQ